MHLSILREKSQGFVQENYGFKEEYLQAIFIKTDEKFIKFGILKKWLKKL
jgi:hypothetical protein